jgi:hypothetical protein
MGQTDHLMLDFKRECTMCTFNTFVAAIRILHESCSRPWPLWPESRGMKIYKGEPRRMPSYSRMVHHQKWPRTHLILKVTGMAALGHERRLWHVMRGTGVVCRS